jgi:hypothetical protein
MQMALTKCRECGHEISTQAASCPNCGRKLPTVADKAGAILAATLLISVVGIWLFSSASKKDPGTNTQQPSSEQSITPQDSKEESNEQTKQACVSYGKMASAFAIDREKQISFSQQVADINSKYGKTAAADEVRNLADFIYNNPAGKMLSSEGADTSMYMDCLMRIGKTKAGAKTYNSEEAIRNLFVGFKTFNGKSLLELFKEYGLKIASVEVTPAEYFKNPDDKPGDKVFLITLANRPSKVMPCRLKSWIHGELLPMPEFFQRGEKFPLIRPEEDDPLIYWAATGKCSEAYSY